LFPLTMKTFNFPSWSSVPAMVSLPDDESAEAACNTIAPGEGTLPPNTFLDLLGLDGNAAKVTAGSRFIDPLFLIMEDSLRRLGVLVTPPPQTSDSAVKKMRELVQLIDDSMTHPHRCYHRPEHVFTILQNLDDPISILAALFHDVVYYQVDGELSPRQAAALRGAITIQSNEDGAQTFVVGDTSISPDNDEPDNLLYMVMSIFGLKVGQTITPFTGLSEYLSAVVAVRELDSILLPRGLRGQQIQAQIACCIEATIPFRMGGEAVMDRSYENMMRTNDRFQLLLTPEQLVESVQRAALLNNEDVGNFASQDAAMFLDNTWSLLPESNPALRGNPNHFSIREMQTALFKMYEFFGFLQPSVVFQRFRGVPKDYASKEKWATRNIELGRYYLGAQLLSYSVLAAFAELTGGDSPVSVFLRIFSISNAGVGTRAVAQPIPRLNQDEVEELGKTDRAVYDLLVNGRHRELAFDARQAPLAAYLYGILGTEFVESTLKKIKVVPMDKEKAERLLLTLPVNTMRIVAGTLAGQVSSRSGLIKHVEEQIAQKNAQDRYFL